MKFFMQNNLTIALLPTVFKYKWFDLQRYEVIKSAF